MSALNIALTLIGGPTVLVEFDGLRLLTDPTFDPPGHYEGKGPVKHEKTSGPALSVDEVGGLDAVLLSHDHHLDNLDHAGRAMLSTVGVTYTTVSGAGRLGGNAAGVPPFETRTLEGRCLTAARWLEHEQNFAGVVTGFDGPRGVTWYVKSQKEFQGSRNPWGGLTWRIREVVGATRWLPMT